ncbi:hypothetical protein FB567DRAFT_546299 [Paraphoma chrysanthemicola]|uniref:Uncharacterized protein n=1 Tax=Paraphoma chrysanthemicola TaxID=798071 RepID=A0A8K0RAS1_9PLEO|nr:hypothetical protein FB567DRAFT_546299 [Paraphoma chrysanthemicola]
MVSLLTFILSLALCLLVAGKDNPPHHAAETWKYHGAAIMETWVGRGAVHAGDLGQEWLYKPIYTAIEEQCHGYQSGKAKYCDWAGYWNKIPTKGVKGGVASEDKAGNRKVIDGQIVDTNIELWAEGKWANDGLRKILINAAAKALEQLTNDVKANCYYVPGRGNMCNIGDFVRINMEPINGEANYLWVTLRSGDTKYVRHDLQCCRSQGMVSDKLNELSQTTSKAYGKPFTKEVRCLVTGVVTCKECGSKCDRCFRSPCA